ncbi:MAG: hypothetical protein IJS39_14055 [Synergistaceae bacterium]|nr:hypothetical protein [Synergistaceae bacterium]
MSIFDGLDEKYSILAAGRKDIDFIGLNISTPELKIYQRCGAQDEISRLLKARGMLINAETVLSSKRTEGIRRTDLAIGERTDSNMEYLFSLLREKTDFFAAHEQAVRKFASLRVTDAEGYKFMSLYHIGLTEYYGAVTALKLYLFLRRCSDPCIDFWRFEYMDQYFIESLKDILAPEYGDLLLMAESILSEPAKHLWMLGIDITSSGAEKIKVYIRNTDRSENIYRLLADVLEKDGRRAFLTAGLIESESWHARHKELKCEGAALGMNLRGEYSLNLYFSEEEQKSV